jgi:glycosyltransferase involved in cell wall biosynthesis
MRIACIAQVRDECDIIELFVKINCRVFDHMYIINNNSVDETQTILDKLKAAGYPITTTFDGDNTYNQDGLTTAALRSVNAWGLYDWFMFLDADEFVDETKEDIIAKLMTVPPHMTPKAMWRSWVPTDINYFEKPNPLYSCFAPLASENHVTYKAICSKAHAPHVKINHGNHAWFGPDGKFVPDADCGVRINHFPVRSVEQITSKAVLSHYRQFVRASIKMNRNPGELGPVRRFFQLNYIHHELQKSKFQVTKEMLRTWGVKYNTEMPPSGNDPQIDSAQEGIHFGFEEDVIQWPELARISLGARFDKQMDIMYNAMKKMEERLAKAGIRIA